MTGRSRNLFDSREARKPAPARVTFYVNGAVDEVVEGRGAVVKKFVIDKHKRDAAKRKPKRRPIETA